MEKKPNFALLIGKKLDEKDKSKPKSSLGVPDDEEMMDSMDNDEPTDEASSMQDSAVADLLSAIQSKSVPMAKQALKDFISLIEDEPDDEPDEPAEPMDEPTPEE